MAQDTTRTTAESATTTQEGYATFVAEVRVHMTGWTLQQGEDGQIRLEPVTVPAQRGASS